MEMTLPFTMFHNITCKGFGADNYAARCVMFMHLCMCMQEHCARKQILHHKLYIDCNIRDTGQNQSDMLVLQKLFVDYKAQYRIINNKLKRINIKILIFDMLL